MHKASLVSCAYAKLTYGKKRRHFSCQFVTDCEITKNAWKTAPINFYLMIDKISWGLSCSGLIPFQYVMLEKGTDDL